MLKTFKLINNDKERKNAKHYSVIMLDELGKEHIHIYTKSNYLIFVYTSKGIHEDTQNQIELPYSSLNWLKDRVINGFWEKPSEGGLPKNKHACRAVFDNEDILISRSINAGYPGKMGFNIINKSRPCHILPSWPQKIQLTDDMIKKHLLPIIDKLTENLK